MSKEVLAFPLSLEHLTTPELKTCPHLPPPRLIPRICCNHATIGNWFLDGNCFLSLGSDTDSPFRLKPAALWWPLEPTHPPLPASELIQQPQFNERGLIRNQWKYATRSSQKLAQRTAAFQLTDRTYRSVLFALICYFFVTHPPSPSYPSPLPVPKIFDPHFPAPIRDAFKLRWGNCYQPDFTSGCLFLQLDIIKFRA
jgi:hypothetical protein